MFIEKTVRFVSKAPLLMHSTRGMDKSDPLVQDKAALTSKRANKKTAEDEIEIQRLEFILAIYHNGERPILPAEMILAAIRDGAKEQKLGKEVTRSVLVNEDAILDYRGPKDVQGLWADRRFVDTRVVRNQQARVVRTRPVFHDWSAVVKMLFDPDYLDEHALDRALRTAGDRVGLGDYRPRFGRFDVEEINAQMAAE